jgi:hypothetical protein
MVPAPFRLNRSGIMLAIVSAAFAGQASAAAGRAEFTIGGVTLQRNGAERTLTRGTELDNGDVVRTNNGRAQIRFTDGSYVSLQPNTEFGIRDYRYEQKTDGSERGFFGLLKGAMRTVTGAIGRINRDRYQIATPTATVGIRGTGGVIQVQDDGSTLVIGTSGIWSLTNPSGSVDVPAGTSAVAPSDPNQPPQETTQQPTSGPAPIPQEEPVFVAGEEVDEQGVPLIPTPALTSGPGYAAAIAHDLLGPTAESGVTTNMVFNAAGQMTQLTALGGVIDIGSGSHADFGTDGILAWGRWIGQIGGTLCGGGGAACPTYSANQGFHYVVGLPTPVLPVTGLATYTLMGATRPTFVDGGDSPGTFTGTVFAEFLLGLVGFDMTVSMSDRGYTIGGTAPITRATALFSSDLQTGLSITPLGNACASGCNASVSGFFAGTNAARAGLGYHISDTPAGGAPRHVVGAAAFELSNIQPSQQQQLIQGGLLRDGTVLP